MSLLLLSRCQVINFKLFPSQVIIEPFKKTDDEEIENENKEKIVHQIYHNTYVVTELLQLIQPDGISSNIVIYLSKLIPLDVYLCQPMQVIEAIISYKVHFDILQLLREEPIFVQSLKSLAVGHDSKVDDLIDGVSLLQILGYFV